MMHALSKHVFFLLMFVMALSGQTSASRPEFEAAVIKIAQKGFVPGGISRKGGPGTSDPGRVTWPRVDLHGLIIQAYGGFAEGFRVRGPAWLTENHATVFTMTATLPPHTTKQEFELMLQSFLAERFRVKLHHEKRMYPGYELVVAPGGVKMKPAATPDEGEGPCRVSGAPKFDAEGFYILPPGKCRVIAQKPDGEYASFHTVTTAELAVFLMNEVSKVRDNEDLHVADSTGLTGAYDVNLKFAKESGMANAVLGPQVRAAMEAAGGMDPEGGGRLQTIFKAVERQLGLRLVKSKGFLLDTVVVDSAEKLPIDN